MPKSVVILGAGSSVPFGLPTLKDFFSNKKSIDYLNQKDNMNFKNDLDNKFWKIRGKLLECSDSSINIEEILTLLREIEYQNKEEFSKRIFCDYDENDQKINNKCKNACITVKKKIKVFDVDFYEKFRKNIYCLIEEVLFKDTTSFNGYLNNLISYCDNNFSKTLWATYNWDCIFESSFYYSMGKRNPYMIMNIKDWHQGDEKHEFIKLHGGINFWLDNDNVKIPRYLSFSSMENNEKTVRGMWDSYRKLNSDDSGYTEKGKPLILEPSYYKYDIEKVENCRFQGCWCYFLSAMIEADFIFIIGYSLPEADQKARSALMIASQLNTTAKWVIVNPSLYSCVRYEQLLGPHRTYLFCKSLERFNEEFIDNKKLDQFIKG